MQLPDVKDIFVAAENKFSQNLMIIWLLSCTDLIPSRGLSSVEDRMLVMRNCLASLSNSGLLIEVLNYIYVQK